MARLGTFKVNDGNVTLTRGRGANKAVVLNVSFKELEIWAARNGVNEKKVWDRAWTRAMSTLRNRLQKVISGAGGYDGVPKFTDFEQFTNELRAAQNKTTPMGGVLAAKKVIIWEKIGKRYYIGWPDRLADWAVNFQDAVGNDDLTNNDWRHYWHKLGIKDIPREYVHNPRRVLPEPFGAHVDKYLPQWAEGAFYKDLAKQMARRVTV